MEPEPPDCRTTMVGDHATGDAEEPEPILRVRWHDFEAAPGDQKYLGNDVLGIRPADPSAGIRGDRRAVGTVERLEALGSFLASIDRHHPASLTLRASRTSHGRDKRESVSEVRGGGNWPLRLARALRGPVHDS